ncbi:energy transducer TonB [Catenovulum sp. SX2]|uniref:energy transducer TonB n=1 Tax=Catenovulum sp. SX2 TaxID=3398614 RepID=UPI003F82BC1D
MFINFKMSLILFLAALSVTGCNSTPEEIYAKGTIKNSSECSSVNINRNIEMPAPRTRSELPTPKIAEKLKISGYVTFSYDITQAGKVANLQVIESYPGDLFNDVLLNTVRQTFTYYPAMKSGKPVVSECHFMTVVFTDGVFDRLTDF